MSVRAENRRRSPWFGIDKPDLAQLATSCEPRQLAYARSVYFAVVETANDQRADDARATQGELAERAGVSVSTLKKCTAALVDAGLLEVHSGRLQGEPNVWVLRSAGDAGVAAPELPGGRATATGVGAPRPGGSRATATSIETGQEEKETPIATQSECDQVWEHYQATRPNGKRCKLSDAEKRIIRNALKVRDLDDCKAAVDGLFRSDYHVQGGYIGIKYALLGGGRSPDPATTIDRLAHTARNGSNGNGRGVLKARTYRGRSWDELTEREQVNVKEAAGMGLEVWDGGADAWQDRELVAAGANGNGNGHGPGVTAETWLDE